MPQESLAYVLRRGTQKREGVAFFIADRLLLTCTHVIKKAGGGVEPGPGTEVKCEFLTNAANRAFDAEVICSFPAVLPDTGTAHEQRYSDIAVLCAKEDERALPLEPESIRMGACRLGRTVSLRGVQDIALGNVDVARGIVSSPTSDGRFEVEVTSSQHARPGFSGGPVMDEHLNIALGMVQETPPKDGGNARVIGSQAIKDAITQYVPDFHLVDGSRERVRADEQFLLSLIMSKDRDFTERELQRAFREAHRDRTMGILLLDAPHESWPEMFLQRVATREFANKIPFAGRTIWGRNWAAPNLMIESSRESAADYEQRLQELLANTLDPRMTDRSDGVDLRREIVGRIALAAIMVNGSREVGATRAASALQREIQSWLLAYERASRPPFCLLLITTERSPYPAQDDRAHWLEGPITRSSDLRCNSLPFLRKLKASQDLAPWIARSSPLIHSKGCDPSLVHLRVLDLTYAGDESREVSFRSWARSLQDNKTEIFGV